MSLPNEIPGSVLQFGTKKGVLRKESNADQKQVYLSLHPEETMGNEQSIDKDD